MELSAMNKVYACHSGTAMFECDVNNPHAKVTWFAGDQEVTTSNKYEIEDDGLTRRLIVHDVSEDDVMDYTCVARDKKTTASLATRGDILKTSHFCHNPTWWWAY